jgi:hypothetical protein
MGTIAVQLEASRTREQLLDTLVDALRNSTVVSRPSVRLTSYNTGFTLESEWDAWVAYVVAHIDEEVGFEVNVDAFAFTGRMAGGSEDEVSGATDEQEAAIREACSHTLWDRGCADNFEVQS